MKSGCKTLRWFVSYSKIGRAKEFSFSLCFYPDVFSFFFLSFYPTVADSQYEEGLFEPIFTEQTEAAFGSIGDKSSTTSTSPQPEKVSPETRRVSMFVHSCPSHFSDINRARKSVFGSIFLRTTGRVVDETNLLKSITESNYSMLQSLLSSFERVISLVPSDTERKHMMQAYKESVMRMLEHVTESFSCAVNLEIDL